MRTGLKAFNEMLSTAADPSVSEEYKLGVIAAYIANEGRAFAEEVTAGIEALEKIAEIANTALGKKEE